MSFDSDIELSLDSKKMRKLFDEEGGEEHGGRELNDEYSQGFRRLKKMRLDENLWQD